MTKNSKAISAAPRRRVASLTAAQRKQLIAARASLKHSSDASKAKFLARYFKCGPGEYGEGDVFIGVTVPNVRSVARKHVSADLLVLKELIASPVHEERLLSLLILVLRFSKGGDKEKREICRFYLNNLSGVNNWDLVDLSAPKILGEYLLNGDRALLYMFARSSNVWRRRIAVLATSAFIRNGDFKDIFALSEHLLADKHDLMHKACGWMLREVGKRDLKAHQDFLQANYKKMPRTMLRYAIERLPDERRRAYLKGEV